MSLSSDGAVMTMPVTPAYQGGNGGFGGWGGDWASWIILFLIFGMFGWGGYGGGWGGNSGNGLGSPSGQGWATRADINEGFALNGLQNDRGKLRHLDRWNVFPADGTFVGAVVVAELRRFVDLRHADHVLRRGFAFLIFDALQAVLGDKFQKFGCFFPGEVVFFPEFLVNRFIFSG